MPVTVRPSPGLVGRNSDPTVSSADALLRSTAKAWSPEIPAYNRRKRRKDQPESRRIIQTSFGDFSHGSSVIPYGNGLVHGIIRAFQQDLHLILRPDNIWLSILIQFSMYVSRNAETLRSQFVAHEGKKRLKIDLTPLPIWDMDMGNFAQLMAELIHHNVVDSHLKDWILPNFTTTTSDDKSVAAIVMMGTLQKYFDYSLAGGCGFPSVTLMGDVADWEEILERVQKLHQYGDEPSQWCRLLVPIIKHMILSFKEPDSRAVKDFWEHACHSAGREGSSDINTISGWVTAFCFWREQGGPVYHFTDDQLERYEHTPLKERKRLILDAVPYPILQPRDIPNAVVLVPVTVEDHHTGLVHDTTMVAGSVGMTLTDKGGDEISTTVQPKSGWWMLEDSVKPASKTLKELGYQDITNLIPDTSSEPRRKRKR